MTIQQITTNITGLVGVHPQLNYVLCDDILSVVTTAGFLPNNSPINASNIDPNDLVLVKYSGGIGLFEPSISSLGIITLSASTAIPDGAIGTAELAALAVTTPKIALLAVNTAQLAALSITTAKIALLAVDTGQLAANAVTTAKITDANVTTGKLANGAVTATQLASDSVTTVKILNSNITLGKLASGITPSHVVKFAGKFSNGGGSATLTITGLTGMDATTYIGFAQIQASTNAVTVQKVTPGTDQMVVLLSGDPGASTVLSYQALLAAA